MAVAKQQSNSEGSTAPSGAVRDLYADLSKQHTKKEEIVKLRTRGQNKCKIVLRKSNMVIIIGNSLSVEVCKIGFPLTHLFVPIYVKCANLWEEISHCTTHIIQARTGEE